MSLVAAPERLQDRLREWSTLHKEHWEELALDKDRKPLDVDLAFYRQGAEAGTVSFIALRDEGRLVGYFVAFVAPCPHYRVLTATMDIFYVHPSVRGRFGGLRLFRAAEREFRRLGVKQWFVGEKLHKPAGRLFRAVGFKPIEIYHSKWIGD
jgi:GNAT superfamily N-acetyltransferase